MKILLVSTFSPFAGHPGEERCADLQEALLKAGHEVDVFRIPLRADGARRFYAQWRMIRGFELRNVDHVVALTLPAYLVRHPQKTLWRRGSSVDDLVARPARRGPAPSP